MQIAACLRKYLAVRRFSVVSDRIPVFYLYILVHKTVFTRSVYCTTGAGGQKTEVVNVRCRLDCTTLSMNDYVELMLTTLSEYPGDLFSYSSLIDGAHRFQITEINKKYIPNHV